MSINLPAAISHTTSRFFFTFENYVLISCIRIFNIDIVSVSSFTPCQNFKNLNFLLDDRFFGVFQFFKWIFSSFNHILVNNLVIYNHLLIRVILLDGRVNSRLLVLILNEILIRNILNILIVSRCIWVKVVYLSFFNISNTIVVRIHSVYFIY